MGEVPFKNANFWNAKFKNSAFCYAKFNNTAKFEGAKFNDAYFSKVIFNDSANFREANFNDADFSKANFSRDANFYSTKFNVVRFSDTTFTTVFLVETDYNSMRVDWSSIENALACDGPAYLKLIKNFREREQFEDADAALYKYRQLRQKSEGRPFLFKV